MKLIFNDATDMPIQSYEKIGGAVRFLTIGIAPEKLKEIFEDATKTKVMNVTERGQIIDTLENYTGYDHTEIYPGGIYGVVNNKAGLSTEERLDDMGIKLETAKQGRKTVATVEHRERMRLSLRWLKYLQRKLQMMSRLLR